jgi:hypothetical protein
MSPANSNQPPVSLPILVALPTAPAWLVSRYSVSTGYKIGSDVFSGGNDTFDNKGGMFKGTIVPKPDGTLPTTVTINVTVEYTPQSGLSNLSKTESVAVTPAGASFTLQLPNRRMSEISIFFEFPHGVLDGDFLTIRWGYVLGTETKTQNAIFLETKNLLPGTPRPASPVVIGFIQDPAPTVPERFHLEIAGRIFNTDLAAFKTDLNLPQSLIIAKIKDDATGGGIHVELS